MAGPKLASLLSVRRSLAQIYPSLYKATPRKIFKRGGRRRKNRFYQVQENEHLNILIMNAKAFCTCLAHGLFTLIVCSRSCFVHAHVWFRLWTQASAIY